jgi:rhodanese-related sulfurtransferase
MKTYQELVAEAKARIREVTGEDVRHLVSEGTDVVLVDIRDEKDWEQGHIPGAVHCPRGVLEQKLPRALPDPDTPIVLYCGGGGRSALATDALQKMGYTDVASMAGGWRGWVASGGPVSYEEGEA